MYVRLQIAALIFMMVQAVFFGVGAILVLGTPLTAHAMELIPWVIAVSVVIALPVSWLMVPWLRLRRRHPAPVVVAAGPSVLPR